MRLLLVMVLACGGSESPAIDEPEASQPAPLFHGPLMRWVFTETNDQGMHHLLVVEAPANEDALQRVVIDKWSQSALVDDKAHFEAFADAPLPFVRSEDGPEPVWRATRAWTLDDERAYGEWVTSTVTEDYLQGTGMLVDCADAAILLRWIFAREHGLPAANILAGSGKLLGQWNTSWSRLPTNPDWRQDERFKAAVRYVMSNTLTHSIVNDYYPVQVGRDFVTPGTIWLFLRDVSGHTETLRSVGQGTCTGRCIGTIWGNVPAAEALFDTEIVSMEAVKKGRGGFMRPRWPVKSSAGWKLVRGKDMPGWSEAIYTHADDDYLDFQDFVYAALGIQLPPYERAGNQISRLMSLLDSRKRVVAVGNAVCGAGDCPEGSALYEAHSTPARDARIMQGSAALVAVLAEVTPEQRADLLSWSDSRMLTGQPETMTDYVLNTDGRLGRMSSDPNASYFARWGVPENGDTLAEGFVHAWRARSRRVEDAQQACFPAGGEVPSCNRASAVIKALSTAREDAGLERYAAGLNALTLTAAGEDWLARTSYDDRPLSEWVFSDRIHHLGHDAWQPIAQRFGL